MNILKIKKPNDLVAPRRKMIVESAKQRNSSERRRETVIGLGHELTVFIPMAPGPNPIDPEFDNRFDLIPLEPVGSQQRERNRNFIMEDKWKRRPVVGATMPAQIAILGRNFYDEFRVPLTVLVINRNGRRLPLPHHGRQDDDC